MGGPVADSVISPIADVGHIHRLVMGAIEIACWDILGKTLGAPVWQLLGGKHRDSILAYANGWYRTERTPTTFVQMAEDVVAKRFKALKLDPFGTAKWFSSNQDVDVTYEILHAPREQSRVSGTVIASQIGQEFFPGQETAVQLGKHEVKVDYSIS